MIYRQPSKDSKKWQSKLIQGNDKNGNTVIFDVNFVTGGYWESGKDNKIVYAGESGGLDKLETQEINEKLAVADEVISVGAADCQGEDTNKQEALSRDRASNLQDKLRGIKILNRERYPNYRRLILGQYLTKYCKDYETKEQRRIVVIFANKAEDSVNINMNEAWENALKDYDSKEKILGDLRLKDYSLVKIDN
ncbi:hypothetical protein [Aerosakkonema funiforme]|uniref:hypothetical protein n=1 Tax=Aerosakkonema funiforme TaxID=1246630 RepID=UPI0035B95FE2